ncbi:hypothetical protein H6769_02630 [Candidatus Peribacteria bacterium]|nr:hypothetical protein [Candidatus Peribacteria bacterium]
MASWNLFSSSREKKAIESIAQEIQSSEAPTGAIGKLSSKVRGMVADVAARVR